MKKPVETEVVATLRDEVSEKAAQIDANLRRTAQNASRLGGLAGSPMLGQLGRLGELAAGGGGSAFAVGGAAIGGFAFERVTASAVEMQRQLNAGEKSMRDLAASAARGVPVLGQFVKGFDNLTELVYGEANRSMQRQADIAKSTAEVLEASFKRSTEAVEKFATETAKLLREAAILALPEGERAAARQAAGFTDQSASITGKLASDIEAEETALIAELRKIAEQRRTAQAALDRELAAGFFDSQEAEVELKRELAGLDAAEARIRRNYNKTVEELTKAATEQQVALHQLEAATLEEADRVAEAKAAEELAKAQERLARESEKMAERIARGREAFGRAIEGVRGARQSMAEFNRDAAESIASRVASMMSGFRGETLQEGFGNFALRGDVAAVQAQGMQMQAEIEANQQRRRQTQLQEQLAREVAAMAKVILRGVNAAI